MCCKDKLKLHLRSRPVCSASVLPVIMSARGIVFPKFHGDLLSCTAATAKAHSALAELKGVAASIPNQSILISTLSLQEAKDSSAIENIITTHDDLYRSDSFSRHFVTDAAKEVHKYATALRNGFEQVAQTGLLTNNDILTIQGCIEVKPRRVSPTARHRTQK